MTKRICSTSVSTNTSFYPSNLFAKSIGTHVLGSAESDTGDARDTGEVQLLEGLASLLLVAVVDHSRTSGELALADLLDLGVVAGVILVLLDGGLLGLLVRKFFNAGVRHFGDLSAGTDVSKSQVNNLWQQNLPETAKNR